METKANEPINTVEYNNNYISIGLTKREYFAAMAMQGILANKSARKKTTEMIIESSVRLSDALLNELNKTK